MLRGFGCKWRKCSFCDYHLDFCADETENLKINREAMSRVTGKYGSLEVINSGSFTELGEQTLQELVTLCRDKKIHTLHFECHWLFRGEIPRWRKAFAEVGTCLKIKTGVESFDYNFRENVLKKGIAERDPKKISESFDECCLLFGLTGQTEESMTNDIETGLKYFERVCVNVFNENKTPIKPDGDVIKVFSERVMPRYAENVRVDILLENTDFGVGGEEK